MRTKTENPNYFKINSEEEPIVLSKYVIDLLLKQDYGSDCIALYCFYYYTAKWQKTNQPKATTEYTATRLNWSVNKVRKIKNILREVGLIEDIVVKNNNVISGHFIKVRFIWSKQISHPNDFSQCGISHSVRNSERNTLSINSKKEVKEKTSKKEILTLGDFEKFWKVYPKKVDKGKALKSWNNLINKKDKPDLKTIMFAIRDQKRSERWQDPQFIPMPTTWINQTRWIDDPATMKVFKPTENKTNKIGYKEADKKYKKPDMII